MAELALFLALVLAVSAGHKLLARERMAVAVARLCGLPQPFAPPANLAVAGLEASAALILVSPETRAIGGALAAALWVAYAAALVRRFGARLDCGCGFAVRSEPIGRLAVGRALGLCGLAALVATLPSTVFTWTTPFAACGFLALYVALGELAASATPQRERAA